MSGEQTNQEKKKGKLFLVSTPIGNFDDITLRAMKVLKSVDIVVCEEPKVGARILHKYNLKQKMELLNEQNEFEKTIELIKMLESGLNLALISDCGTPVFADPGLMLVRSALSKHIDIVVVPGVTSIMTALVRSGFDLSQFLYAGFLSRDKQERILQLKRLKNEAKTVVLFETPYRLMPLLEAASTVMPSRRAYLGCNLTMPYETHHYGTFEELYNKMKNERFKGEFVICFEGASLDEVVGEEDYKPKKIDQSPQRKKIIKRSEMDTSRVRNKTYPKKGGAKFPSKTRNNRTGSTRKKIVIKKK